ncbi:hypothetical protein HDU86_005786 [Geranomyces michiganensis]|nr:hypothetical protein HDU86_005786 [Geranomyces michiganensis]
MSIETPRLFIHPLPTTDSAAVVRFWASLYLDERVSKGWDSSAPGDASRYTPERLAVWREKLLDRFARNGYGAHVVEMKARAVDDADDGGVAPTTASLPTDDARDRDRLPKGPTGGHIIGVIELRTLTTTDFATMLQGRTVTAGDVELAYFFHPVSWGRGFATEAVTALVGWAMNEQQQDDIDGDGGGGRGPRLKMVSGSCVDSNSASKKVMQAAGLKPVEDSLGFNGPSEIYFRRTVE